MGEGACPYFEFRHDSSCQVDRTGRPWNQCFGQVGAFGFRPAGHEATDQPRRLAQQSRFAPLAAWASQIWAPSCARVCVPGKGLTQRYFLFVL